MREAVTAVSRPFVYDVVSTYFYFFQSQAESTPEDEMRRMVQKACNNFRFEGPWMNNI